MGGQIKTRRCSGGLDTRCLLRKPLVITDDSADPESDQETHEQAGGMNLVTLVELLIALEPELDALDPLAGLFGRELENLLQSFMVSGRSSPGKSRVSESG